MATCKIISGNPILKYSINDKWYFSFSRSPAATRFALEPMIVPFPHRHAPKASAHQRNVASTQAFVYHSISVATTGSITAVNGILSRNAENIAEIHNIAIAHMRRLSPNCLSIISATTLRSPVCSTAPTIIKRNTKNQITSHSTSREKVSWILCSIISFDSWHFPNFLLISLSLMSIKRAAHIIAGTAAGIWKNPWRKKNIITSANTMRDDINSFLCLILYCFFITLSVSSKFSIFFAFESSHLIII